MKPRNCNIEVELWCSKGCGSWEEPARAHKATSPRYDCGGEPPETEFDEDAKCPECGSEWCDEEEGRKAAYYRMDNLDDDSPRREE